MEEIIRILREKVSADPFKRFDYNALRDIVIGGGITPEKVDETIFELEQKGYIYSSNGFYRVVRETTKKGMLDVTHRGTLFIMDGEKNDMLIQLI